MVITQLSPPPNAQPLPRKRLHISLPHLSHGAVIFSPRGTGSWACPWRWVEV